MKKYKLVTQDMKTRKGQFNETDWQVGVDMPELSGEGGLCSKGFYHCYHDPLLAVLLNPMHADIDNPRCFVVEGSGKYIDDNGIKCGFTKIRLVEEIELANVSIEQRIAFAILCAKEVCKNKRWNQWADDWLSGRDRSSSAAAFAARSAANAAISVAAAAATSAANAAADVHYAFVYHAANAAAYAAASARWAYKKLLSIARMAMKY